MADSSPPAGLLDQAERILDLVSELGSAIWENDPSPSEENRRRVASAWKALLPAIVEVGDSLPSERSSLADWIREVGRVSQRFDGITRQHGLADVLFRFNCDGFNRVAREGRQLLDEQKPQRAPFAFVDEPAADKQAGIDTTPTLPKPPAGLVEAALLGLPNILANVVPRDDGAIEMVASHLVKRLQDAGHTLATAHWAVHEAVRTRRLRPGLMEVEIPSFGRAVGGTMRHLGGPDDRRVEWSGGGKETVPIPQGKPAPFDSFKVTATESLWAWWRSLAVPESASGEADIGDSSFVERLLAGPNDAELTARELALLEAYLKQPASLAAIQQERPTAGKSETSKNQNKLKLIRDFNRNRQAADVAAESDDSGKPESDGPTETKPKRRGRKKASYETVQCEAKLAADWGRARDSGVHKADFAREQNMTLEDFDRLLDRVAARNKHSE